MTATLGRGLILGFLLQAILLCALFQPQLVEELFQTLVLCVERQPVPTHLLHLAGDSGHLSTLLDDGFLHIAAELVVDAKLLDADALATLGQLALAIFEKVTFKLAKLLLLRLQTLLHEGQRPGTFLRLAPGQIDNDLNA